MSESPSGYFEVRPRSRAERFDSGLGDSASSILICLCSVYRAAADTFLIAVTIAESSCEILK